MIGARLLPPSATADARRLIATRSVRALVDGLVSVLLPAYLTLLGFSGTRIGAIATATMLGSAALTLGAGLWVHRVGSVLALQIAAIVMTATGVAFGILDGFIAILIIGALGTLNPSGGDVSVFLPLEQSLLPLTADDRDRTALFARFALAAALFTALGSALSTLAPETKHGYRAVFTVYALAGAIALAIYRRLSVASPPSPRRAALGPSRRTVYRLAAVFSIDSFGSGFASQTILILWLHRRYGLSTSTTGAIFAAASLMSAASILGAERIARRIGLIRTMAFTHLPASALFIVAAIAPAAWLAVGALIIRALFSQMDIPARTSYVMAVVAPDERAAAAGITNVPRSLAAAAPPALAGYLLDRSTFGWPLIIAGVLRIAYDLILLAMFRNRRPPEEEARR